MDLGLGLGLNRVAPSAGAAPPPASQALKFNVASNSQYIPVIGA